MIGFLARSVVVAGVLLATTAPATHAAPRASCYGPGLWGNPMADGTILRTSTIAVASKSLPLGTRLRVRAGGRTITVTVKDRGPFVPGRHLDLTQAAVAALGFRDCNAWGVREVRSWRAH